MDTEGLEENGLDPVNMIGKIYTYGISVKSWEFLPTIRLKP